MPIGADHGPPVKTTGSNGQIHDSRARRTRVEIPESQLVVDGSAGGLTSQGMWWQGVCLSLSGLFCLI